MNNFQETLERHLDILKNRNLDDLDTLIAELEKLNSIELTPEDVRGALMDIVEEIMREGRLIEEELTTEINNLSKTQKALKAYNRL